MFERLTPEGRMVYFIAGEFAAARQREADGLGEDEFVGDVKIGVKDIRMATALCTNSAWAGSHTHEASAHIFRRLEATEGELGVREFRDALAAYDEILSAEPEIESWSPTYLRVVPRGRWRRLLARLDPRTWRFG